MENLSFNKLYTFKAQVKRRRKNREQVYYYYIFSKNLEEAKWIAELQDHDKVQNIEKVNRFVNFCVHFITKKPKESNFSTLFERLAKMMHVGFPLEKALRLQFKMLTNPYEKYFVARAIASMGNGQKFSDVIEEWNRIFSKASHLMLRHAEDSNGLNQVLLHIGTYQRLVMRIIKRIKSEMIYPAFVFITGILVACGLGFFFLPTLENIYASFGAQLPLLTQFFLSFINAIKACPIVLLIPFVVIVTACFQRKRLIRLLQLDRLLMLLPGIGKFLWKRDLLLSFQFLLLLLKSGIPMANALNILREATQNKKLKQAFEQIYESITNGHDVAGSFLDYKEFFEKDGEEIANVVEIGDKTGDLNAVLSNFLDNKTEEMNFELDNFSKVLKPVLTIGITFFVSLVIFIVVLPLMQLTSVFVQNVGH